jgi:hypothetical protein
MGSNRKVVVVGVRAALISDYFTLGEDNIFP